MKLIDLTQVISPKMPVYPNTEPPKFNHVCTLEKYGFREIELTLYTHTGTHLDCPSHLLQKGETIEELSVEQFYGKAMMVDCRNIKGDRIELEYMKPFFHKIKTVDFVLFHTGWSEKWGTAEYFKGFPVPTVELAEKMATLSIKGVGIDAISVDPIDTEGLKVHNILLNNKIIIIENLTNLNKINNEYFTFSCFPLNIQQGDGSPIRAVAIEE